MQENECTHDCESCSENCASRSENEQQPDFSAKMNSMSQVRHVVGVVSGKGGVGKSLVTGLLAVAMRRLGYSTAILDADITGPSIPKMFGITQKARGNETGILPQVTESGIKVMSVNLLLENEEDPVVWRGPIIAGTVKQFWSDVVWGDVDYMFVDMPPGTGDVPLTVFQSLPVEGIVIVSSPQELVSMIVKKAVNMAKMMDIPVLGMVENMSYFQCPDCGKKLPIFGEEMSEETASQWGARLLGRIPVEPELARLCDKGKLEQSKVDYLATAARELTDLLKQNPA